MEGRRRKGGGMGGGWVKGGCTLSKYVNLDIGSHKLCISLFSPLKTKHGRVLLAST